MRNTNKKGFTIVELVIVVAVIAILAAVLIPTFSGIIDKANMSVDQQFVNQLNKIIAIESAAGKPADIAAVRALLDRNDINTFDATHKKNVFYYDVENNSVLIWNKAEIGDDLTGSVVFPDQAANAYADLTLPKTPANGWEPLREPVIVASGANAKVNVNLDQLGTVQASGCDGVFYAKDGATITVNGDGDVVADLGDKWAMAVWAKGENSKVVINGGTFTQNLEEGHLDASLIYASGKGVVEIKGGTFKATDPQWTLNLSDNSGSQIIVTGGEFYEYDPSNSYTETGWNQNQTYSFVAEGYSVVWQTRDGHEWFKVVEGNTVPDGWNSLDSLPELGEWCEWADEVTVPAA